MDTKLEELIRNRKEIIEVFSKTALSDGINSLFNDLYPNNAHFIYELLQNAEDMDATEVRLSLFQTYLRFEHNGTRRSFDVDDIDAITNIRQFKQKINDPVTSGKFGIGFKAVFAYTSSPEIHSGEYHFMIKDYCIPEFEGVEYTETIDREGVSWTVFILPFNNPLKPPQTAYQEILKDLITLDDSSVLFLQNITRIVYSVDDERTCTILRSSENAHILTTSCSYSDKPDQTTVSRWLYFSRQVMTHDDPEKQKSLPVAAAFSLKYDDEKKKDKIVPVKHPGKTFIYFPAENENSGLRFYINAPFASTAARNSIAECEENTILIQKISDLVYESLLVIRDMGFIDFDFLKVMPNKSDISRSAYIPVYNKIILAFMTYDIFPAGSGQYCRTEDIITGPAEIFHLLEHNDFNIITGHKQYWIPALTDPRQRLFLDSFNILNFDENDFWNLFPDKISCLIKTKNDDWIKDLYCLCGKLYTKDHYKFSFSFNTPILTNIKTADIIPAENGTFHKPQEIYYGNENSYNDDNTNILIKKTITDPGDIRHEQIMNFLKDVLSIREYGQNIVIENKLKKYVQKQSVKPEDLSDEYFSDLISIAEYDKSDPLINLPGYRLFLYEKDGELVFEKPGKLFLGKNYGYTDGQILSDNLDIPLLWNGYFERCNDQQIEAIISFALKCGIKKGLDISACRAEDNPDFDLLLNSPGEKDGSGTNEDYNIYGLEELLKKNNTDINLIIWKTLKNCFKKEFAYAVYSPNKDTKVNSCDSHFISTLKQYKWIPDKTGILHTPEDISEDELDPRYEYSFIFPLLKALQLKDKNTKESDEVKKLREKASEFGYRMIPEEEAKAFENYLKKQKSQENT